MELRFLGNSGLRVSRLGLGTMTWARDTDENEAADQLKLFTEIGGNFIDTAASYADGDAELLIGSFVGKLVARDELVISTKAGVRNSENGLQLNNSRLSLIEQLNNSLTSLKTDYIDLWQIQAWDENIAIEETLSVMDYAVHSGKVRYIGVSNLSGWQLALVSTLQNPTFGKNAIVSIQSEYSLVNRKVETEILPAALYLNAGFLAWSPLGRGVLTGKYRNGIPSDSRGATGHLADFIEPYLNADSQRIVDAVCVAAEGLGYSPLEVSLAWVRDTLGVSSAIVGARTAAQFQGALLAEEITLPTQVRTALDEISALDY